MTACAACLVLGVELAASLSDLAAYWQENQSALRMLAPDELAAVVAVKDQRKSALALLPE